MKRWKCGGHMTRYNGSAYCDQCGRMTFYKTKRDSGSGNDDFYLAAGLGALIYAVASKIKVNRNQSEPDENAFQKIHSDNRSERRLGKLEIIVLILAALAYFVFIMFFNH